MPKFKAGQSGNPPGRPRGSQNKYSTIKQAFLEAFEEIGGTKTLTNWAKDNQKDFYSMIVKLLPKGIELGTKDDEPLAWRMTYFPPQPKTVKKWQAMVKELENGKV